MFLLPLVIFAVVSCGGGGDSSTGVPSAPTGVMATAGHSSASIAWDNVGGATSYNVYHSTTTGVTKTTGTKIAGVSSPNIVTGLTNGTPYYFVVTAVNANGESADSTQVSTTPTLAPPAAPTNVTAIAGHGEATIVWDNVAGAASYNIYYLTTSGVTKTTGNKLANRTSPSVVTGLTNGTTHYFVVTAVNAAAEGPISSEVSATPTPVPPPPPPTGVTATAGHREVTINWSAVTGATSYNIYFSTTSPVTKTAYLDKLTGVTTSSRFVTGLANGTTYYFVVTAVSVNGESVESSQVSATPILPTPPLAPTNVTATAGDVEATIGWSAVTGATSYNIYFSTTSPVTKTAYLDKLTGIITSPKSVTGLFNLTKYYFVVTAVNAGGESVESSQDFATPNPTYIAVGDSITVGQEDDIPTDGTGYEPILANLLTTSKGYQITVANEGVGGTTSADGVASISSTLSKYPSAKYYLVQYGTNDAGVTLPPIPSGKGLHFGQPGYSGSYKENMQRIISAVVSEGKMPFLAKVPYAADPIFADTSIRDYNVVIDELVAENGISVTPPDFYNLLAHPGDFSSDGFHPNGTGYQSMANLWIQALVP